MKIKYFQDTDTLYIEFRATEIAERRIWMRIRCITHPQAAGETFLAADDIVLFCRE